MQLQEIWTIKETDTSQVVWNIYYDASREGNKIIVSNETNNCFVGNFNLSDWRERLEAVVYYYLRKSLISTQKCFPGADFQIVSGPSPEEWFQSPAYQLFLKRIGK